MNIFFDMSHISQKPLKIATFFTFCYKTFPFTILFSSPPEFFSHQIDSGG
jgi:hypothetical protein